jgi:hypothetical protein
MEKISETIHEDRGYLIAMINATGSTYNMATTSLTNNPTHLNTTQSPEDAYTSHIH